MKTLYFTTDRYFSESLCAQEIFYHSLSMLPVYQLQTLLESEVFDARVKCHANTRTPPRWHTWQCVSVCQEMRAVARYFMLWKARLGFLQN